MLPRTARASTARAWTRWSAAAVAACLAVAAGMWQGNGGFRNMATSQGTPYALVGLDINPSVTLTVSRRLRVQSVTANDADGQTVVKQLPQLAGEQMQQAVAQVVQQAIADHLLPNSDSIVITGSPVQAKDAGQIPSLVGKAKRAVDQSLQQSGAAQSLDPKVFSVSIPASVFGAAKQAQIPPGQVASYLLAQHDGMTVGHVDAQTIRQIFGNGASLPTVTDSQSRQQITMLLNQLKHTGVLGNAAPGKSGSNHPNQSGHGKGRGTAKNHGNVSGGVGNNLQGGVGGTMGKIGNDNGNLSVGVAPVDGKDKKDIKGIISNTLRGDSLGNLANSAQNTTANEFVNPVDNALGALKNNTANERFFTPSRTHRGVSKH